MLRACTGACNEHARNNRAAQWRRHSRNLVLQALNVVVEASGPLVIGVVYLLLHEGCSLQ